MLLGLKVHVLMFTLDCLFSLTRLYPRPVVMMTTRQSDVASRCRIFFLFFLEMFFYVSRMFYTDCEGCVTLGA